MLLLIDMVERAPLKLLPESGSGAAQERAPITNAAAQYARPGPGTTELTLIGQLAGGPSALAGYESGARRLAGRVSEVPAWSVL